MNQKLENKNIKRKIKHQEILKNQATIFSDKMMHKRNSYIKNLFAVNQIIKNIRIKNINAVHIKKKQLINKIKNIKNYMLSSSMMNSTKIDFKNYKLYQSHAKNLNKLESYILPVSLIKNNNKKNIDCDISNFFSVNNTHKNIEWKKAISQQLLFFILNKNHQAEIYLKPKNFGSIHIRIKVKNDNTIVNLTSNNSDIHSILNDSIPYLKKSLIKSGLQISEINVNSILNNQSIKKETGIHSNKLIPKKDVLKCDHSKTLFMSTINKKEYLNALKVDIYI